MFSSSVFARKLSRVGLAALAVSGLAACVTPVPSETYQSVRPTTDAARTATSFSESLSCMDELFVAQGVRDYRITTIGIPDATGQITTGTRDMLISAVSQMTRRSRAFTYVDYELDRTELSYLHQKVGGQSNFPTFYIRGAVTQLDQNVNDWRKGGGVSGGYDGFGGDFAFDKNETVSVVALDMNVGEVATRQIIPGLTASNSLAVSRREEGAQAGLTLKYAGAYYSIELSKSEGMHYAVRTLLELGTVEILGKLARVPYWECLQIESTNPQVVNEVANWYSDMSDEDKLLFAQRALIAGGYLAGPASGRMDPESRTAIARFQTESDLIPTGRLDFQVYMKLLGSDRPLAAGPPSTYVEEGVEIDLVADTMPTREPVVVTIESERGPEPSYAPYELFRARVNVSESAFLYCFYRDGEGEISRIYPNRFQADAYVAGGRVLEIPGRSAPFEIRFDDGESIEEIACVASEREVGLYLDEELKTVDLSPLPVTSVDELISVFRDIDPNGLGVARMSIRVTTTL